MDQASLFEPGQIATHAGCRSIKLLRQFIDGDVSPAQKGLKYDFGSLIGFGGHGMETIPLAS
jgi:hypothetical protein